MNEFRAITMITNKEKRIFEITLEIRALKKYIYSWKLRQNKEDFTAALNWADEELHKLSVELDSL